MPNPLYHHHHVVLVARISLTLSRHSSLTFIAPGRSSGPHPVSSHSCWMYVRAGRPAFARPCVGVHKSTSLMSSSLLLQQCPACLVRLTWIVFVIGGRWPYSWCLVGCCRQDLFKLAWFYGISTIVSYLMPNPLYVYVLNIYNLVLFCLVLWHINHYRLFNIKSIFMHINSSISNNSVKHKYTV